MALGLGKGEASLFLTPQDDRLILDEPPARTVAESEGRVYVGLLGFHMASHLYEAVVQDLREQE